MRQAPVDRKRDGAAGASGAVPRRPEASDGADGGTRARVAAHYDDLDPFYRDLWGEHVHHGLWKTGRESPAVAVRQLVDLVAAKGRAARAKVCDVGCGYGGTARILAADYGAAVTALSVSERQLAHARRQSPGSDNPLYRLEDWLNTDLPSGAFDLVVAIESVSHMADRARFYRQACRVLRPGGRLVACLWLDGGRASAWGRRHLLDPICEEGCLAALEPKELHLDMLAAAGLELEEFQDLSRSVRGTWTVCIRRGLSRLTTRRYRRFFFDRGQPNRRFAWSLFRIWWAYRTGALAYGLLVARKPDR